MLAVESDVTVKGTDKLSYIKKERILSKECLVLII